MIRRASTTSKKRSIELKMRWSQKKNTELSSVDGGDGTDYIVSMITKLANDACTLALASKLGGDKLGIAQAKLTETDESVAQTFLNMKKEVH